MIERTIPVEFFAVEHAARPLIRLQRQLAELAAHPRAYALIESEVRRLTTNLAQYEAIKRIALLPEDFTFDGGSLTFTMKLKRRVVEEQYAGVIAQLYADVAEPRPA